MDSTCIIASNFQKKTCNTYSHFNGLFGYLIVSLTGGLAGKKGLAPNTAIAPPQARLDK